MAADKNREDLASAILSMHVKTVMDRPSETQNKDHKDDLKLIGLNETTQLPVLEGFYF